MDSAVDTFAKPMQRVPPAEVLRLVRLLEAGFKGRDTAQVPVREKDK